MTTTNPPETGPVLAAIDLDTEPTARGDLYWQPDTSPHAEPGAGSIWCLNRDTGEMSDTHTPCSEEDARETIAASWGMACWGLEWLA
jgi:hypothetical protein